LDIVCDQWDALVEDDYVRIMPLPYRSRLWIDTLYQPEFAQQLGVFSVDKLSPVIVADFISTIPSRFKMQKLALNAFNKLDDHLLDKRTELFDYKIDLIQDYERIADSYTVLTRQRIDMSQRYKMKLLHGISPALFVSFYQQNNRKLDNFTALRFKSLVSTLTKLKVGSIMGVFNEDDQLIVAALFVSYLNNASLLAQAVSAEGTKKYAFYRLLDSFLKINAQKNVTLDFPDAESANLQGLYEGFGCLRGSYSVYNHTAFPRVLHWMFN